MRTEFLEKKNIYPNGANSPTEHSEFLCPCGKGKIIEENVRGFCDHYVWIECDACEKKYSIEHSDSSRWEVVLRETVTQKEKKMLIRTMQKKDGAAVLSLMRGFYDSPAILCHAPTEILQKDIDACVGECPFVEGIVAEIDGVIAGYAMMSKGFSTEYGGISVMIEDLFVTDEHRGRGLGAALLRHIEEKYKDTAVRLRLEVEPSNAGAMRLYEKCGYRVLPYTQMTKEL